MDVMKLTKTFSSYTTFINLWCGYLLYKFYILSPESDLNLGDAEFGTKFFGDVLVCSLKVNSIVSISTFSTEVYASFENYLLVLHHAQYLTLLGLIQNDVMK